MLYRIHHIPKPRSRGRGSRRAFTLLEVLFALGLSLLLMAAVLSAIELYSQMSTAGRRDVEEAQLVRAILRSMELDIRSATFYNPALEGGQGQEEQEQLFGTEELGEEPLDVADAYATTSVGIIGDAGTLIIHVRRPPRRLESILLAEAGEPDAVGSDLKSVAYFLATPSADGLQGAAGSLLDTEGTGAVQGLARLEGDRLSLQFADAAGDLQTLAENTSLLAPEVDYLQFRYYGLYEGTSLRWDSYWDSVTFDRLPLAVEITIGIDSVEALEAAGMTAEDVEVTASGLYRFVVTLPTAAPIIEMY